jgi:transcription initiation factor IIE alpha subunit
MPTRILLQLKDLFTTLKSLDEAYSDEKALKILRNIASSSIHPIRLQIILELIQSEPLTTTAIQKRLSIGWKTVLTQLYTAKQLGLVDFVEIDETEEGAYRNWKKKSWFLTKHEVNDYIKAKMAKTTL